MNFVDRNSSLDEIILFINLICITIFIGHVKHPGFTRLLHHSDYVFIPRALPFINSDDGSENLRKKIEKLENKWKKDQIREIRDQFECAHYLMYNKYYKQVKTLC